MPRYVEVAMGATATLGWHRENRRWNRGAGTTEHSTLYASGDAGVHTGWDRVRKRVYIGPGEWHLDEKPSQIVTVVGSCIAVVAYDPSRRMGVLCHCVLPAGDPPVPDPARPALYVEQSIPELLGWFARRGIGADDVEFKLFGGADLADRVSGYALPGVGRRNTERCAAAVREYSLRVTASDLGGTAELDFQPHGLVCTVRAPLPVWAEA